MKRILLGGLGLGLGLAPHSLWAEELAWRAVGSRPAQTAPAPITPAAPANPVYRFETGRAAPASQAIAPVGWIRVRAQSEEPAEEPAAPLPQAPGTPAMPTTLPAVIPQLQPAKPEMLMTPRPQLPPGPSYSYTTQPPAAAGEQPVYLVCDNPMEVAQGLAPRLQVSAEYLLWWVKGSQVPPLLTTSPPNGANGIPGTVPGSTVLIGGEDLDDATRHGGRFGFVWWLDRCASYGFDARIFFTGERTNDITVSSRQTDGADIALFRPFFAPNTFTFNGVALPGPFREQVTANGVATGSFTAHSSSFFWGAEANYRDNVFYWCDCNQNLRGDLLVGFRYLHLDEDLVLAEDAVRLVPSTAFPDEVAGTRVVVTDRFKTTNDFYGGQVGGVTTYTRDRWSVDLRGTVALGTTHQKVTIDGSQVRGPLANGGTFVSVGGLYALNSNIGNYSRNVFSVVPEIGLNLGYQVTDHWRAFVGYNFLYWSNIVRPADQIDTVIDVTRVPRFVPPGTNIAPINTPRPAPLLGSTDFWAQGVNFGAEYRW